MSVWLGSGEVRTVSLRAGSAGYTLLELLIAMSLGLFLVAGLVQVLMANQSTFRLQENLARLQEDGRFASEVMAKHVAMAGYRVDSTTLLESEFTAYTTTSNPPALAFLAGEVIRGDDNNVGSGDDVDDGTDTLAVRYQGAADNTTVDCMGRQVNSGNIAVNRFYVNNNALYCRSDIYNASSGAIVGAATIRALVDNVEDMQLSYGMNTDGALYGDVSAHCYLDLSVNIGSGNDCSTFNFSRVVSVRISLLLKTGSNNMTAAASNQTYTFNGGTVTATDRHLYREFSSTVALRNKVL